MKYVGNLWTYLAQDWNMWRDLVNILMGILIP
jgi:hypothetical protein